MRTPPLFFLLPCLFISACEGTLSIDISGTPPESVNAAVLHITGMTLTGTDGSTREVDIDDQDIDFLDLDRGNVTALLRDKELTTGDYTAVQLHINAKTQAIDSYLENLDGGQDSLLLQAASTATARGAFSVREDKDTRITLHLDFRSSLLPNRNAAQDRLLSPRLRVVETGAASSISGNVDTAVLTGSACDSTAADAPEPVMYVYSGANVTPDDIDGVAPDPLTTALVRLSEIQADYVASFLPAGDYTLALTCAAGSDSPNRNDDIRFLASHSISLAASSNATLNFTN